MRSFLLTALLLFSVLSFTQAQVFDVNDPIVNYDEANPPANPPSNTIAKWVRTPGVSWNTQKWKSYVINGMPFRLRFPNNYNPNRAEKYPVIVILHGRGFQNGDRYMNERHLNNSGAKAYEDGINKGRFDGFVLSPQADGGWFNENHVSNVNQIITQAGQELNFDVDRVSINGRSAGAQSVWLFMQSASRTFAAAAPMAGVKSSSTDNIDAYKHMPLWIFQGELDDGPSPFTVEAIIDQIVAKKGNVRYTKYKRAGHGIFDKGYAESDYFTFYSTVHKANPAVLSGEYLNVFEDNNKWVYDFLERNELCEGDPINVRLGLTAGFNDYEWKKDGQIISGANSNEYVATSYGTYEARFKRGNTWSVWSPKPIEVKLKDATSTPDIQLVENVSTYLPSLDGSTSVQLELPQGYASYEWRDGNNAVVGSNRVFEANQPGNYKALVVENFGCSSDFSNVFSIVNADAANGPQKPLALNGVAVSKTEIKLVWSLNLSDPNPATKLEVFRSSSESGSFEFVKAVEANSLVYNDLDLDPNTSYYYQVRTVNNNAASPPLASNAIVTLVDELAPSTPVDLTVGAVNAYSVELSWNESSDDVGVYRYDVYKDGIKVASVDTVATTIYNLQSNRIYKFRVKARDLTGNESPFSNRVVIATAASSSSLTSLKLNGDLVDASGNNTSSSISGQPSFNSSEKVEGSASIEFNGNGFIDLDRNDLYIHDAFDERSIAFWIKQTSSNGTQYVFDEGGSTNGIAFRVNSGTLEFAVRNGNVQRTISGTLPTNDWTHVAGVYQSGVLQLFINGIKVDEDNAVPYSTVNDHGNNGGIGGTNSSNAFGGSGGGLVGFMDDFNIYGSALTQTQVQEVMDISNVVGIPEETIYAPENITATAISYEEISIGWDDMSDNETQFQLYRSKEGESMQAIAILPANTISYNDKGLAPETKYTYQVEALTDFNGSMSAQSMIPSLVRLDFEGDLSDESGNDVVVQNNGVISFVADNSQGASAISFDGNSILNIDNGNQFIHSAFTERSVAFWYKSLDASGNQDVYDEGGSTNGFGIRLIGESLQLTTQNGHQIFSVQALVSRNEWHHVMGVYQSGSLRLYVDGLLVASRSDLSYTTVNTHGDAGGLGGTNGSNAFDTNSDNFRGYIDHFYAFDQAMDAELAAIIQSANPGGSATTLALPAPPVAVANLAIENVGLNFVELSFDDMSSDETHFELNRAINAPTNFQPLAEINGQKGGSVSYLDEGLDSHVVYYYEVKAINAGGSSDAEVISVTTLNNIPELYDLPDYITIRYDSEYDVNLYGTDADEDQLSISGINLPSFASIIDYGDGSGVLRFNPTIDDMAGSPYEEIIVSMSDAFGGIAYDTLTLVINNNHLPELSVPADVSLNEGESTIVNLQANDVEGTANLSWSYELPSFAQLNINVDGSAELTLSPGYADHGDYTAVVTVTDVDEASASSEFLISVSDTDPNQVVLVNFTDGSLLGGTNWNNTTGHPSQGDAYNSLVDTKGTVSSFGVSISSNWTNNGSNTYGSVTGDNSGVYPDAVMQSAYWTASATEEVTVTGLDDSKVYNLRFFGSRQASNDRTTRYSVGASSVELNAASNTSQTVSLVSLSPQNGSLQVSISKAGASSYGYLNAMEIIEIYDDGALPAAARNLSASYNAVNSQIELSWSDQAYNERNYKVYRSETEGGVYELLATLNAGSTSYVDTDISANSEYFYQIGSSNTAGETLSELVSVEIPNVAPVITALDDVSVEIGSSLTISVTATDDAGDEISLSVVGLPSFGSFSDLGSGSGLLEFSPLKGEVGVFTIEVLASDGKGQSSETFELSVEEEGLHNYYINFAGSTTYSAPSPWNNYVGGGSAGSSLGNINADVAGENVLQLSLETGWNGYNTSGETGTGLYPDNVTSTALWVSGTQERQMRISGLSTDKAYDFTFYGSRSGGGDRTMQYSINGASVSLNAAYNIDNTVSIEGVIPQSDGTILISFEKASSASYGYVNALVVTGYQAASIPATPSNLVATPTDNGAINLVWRDNTNLESAYEVWKSTDNGFNYSLLVSLDADVLSYTDGNSLQSGTTYYYKVRAQVKNGPTAYSNVAGASVYNMVSKINFNAADPQGSPWNNTNGAPEKGAIYTDMKDANNNSTGIAFEVVESNPAYDISLYGFDGDNPFGENTGNNSGVVPDNVMRSTWWMDQGKTAELRFFNLDLSQVYKFSFFASRAGTGNRTSVYTVNGKSVKLNAANNIDNIVSIPNLQPDDNGELVVRITTDDGAIFSYLGAIIISSSNAIDPQVAMKDAVARQKEKTVEPILELSELGLYPNPYRGNQALSLNVGTGDSKLEISVISLQGHVIFNQKLNKESELNTIELEGIKNISSGMYLLRVNGDQNGLRTIRFIKQ